jgi:hypothetical protein
LKEQTSKYSVACCCCFFFCCVLVCISCLWKQLKSNKTHEREKAMTFIHKEDWIRVVKQWRNNCYSYLCVLLMVALLLLWVHPHTHNAIGEQACVLFLDFLFFIGSNCLKK